MEPATKVTYETYYFQELLETIRRRSGSRLSEEGQGYLNKLLAPLSAGSEAMTGIEKLAASATTSDLAIFFSDILEHLRQLSPNEAMEKVTAHADDFLDIFELIFQNSEWRATVDAAQQAAPAAQTEESLEIGILDYCRKVIEAEIAKHSATLPDPLREATVERLHRLVDEPEMVQHLRSGISDPKMEEFVAAAARIHPPQESGSLDTFFSDFHSRVCRWADLFVSLSKAQPDAVAACFEPPAAGEIPQAAEEEVPFESLFEQAEAADEGETADEVSAAAEVEELAEKVSNLEGLRPKDVDEQGERERRALLRDYIQNELRAFRDDILQGIGQATGAEFGAEEKRKLHEDLKGLKDLGQIHGYEAVEKTAEQLLQLLNAAAGQQRALPPSAEPVVQAVFDLLPGYVDAAIADGAEEENSRINQKLAELRRQWLGEDLHPINSVDTLTGALQEVVGRLSASICSALEAGETSRAGNSLAAAFDSLDYWTGLLGLSEARMTTAMVKEMATESTFSRFSPEDRKTLIGVVHGWEKAFVNCERDAWHQQREQLGALLEKLDEVEISAAQAAFHEVATRELDGLIHLLHHENAAVQQVLMSQYAECCRRISENSQLIGQSGWRGLFAELSGAARSGAAELNGDSDELRSGLLEHLHILKELLAGQAASSAEPDEILAHFRGLLQQSKEEKEEAAVGEPQAAAEEESAATAGQEILEVFVQEAANYMKEIDGHLSNLEGDPHNKRHWHELGITIHTLKGSAQMVGRQDIAELAKPLDAAIDLIETESLRIEPSLLPAVTALVSCMRQRIEGKQCDSAQVLAGMDRYLTDNTLAAETASVPQAPADEAPEVTPADSQVEMIHLAEQDPELLEIFRSEVIANFDVVEENLTNLEKFTYDREALQHAERAIHDIRGAAKMLGIREIAEIGDKLEKAFELLILQKIQDLSSAIPITRRAMFVIRELTTTHAVRRQIYEEVDRNLSDLISGKPQQTAPAGPAKAEPVKAGPVKAGPVKATAESPESQPPIGMQEPTPQVLELYLQEAHEQLDDINYLLLKLEKDPENEELQHHLMRCLHTLKGSSAMVSAGKIETLAHRCEDIIEANLKSKRMLTPELFDLLFSVLDEVSHLLDGIRSKGRETPDNYDRLLSRLREIQHSAEPQTVAAATPEETPEVAEAEPAGEESPVMMAAEAEQPEEAPRKETFLRLNIAKMNHLLNMAAELVISNNQFKNQLDRLKNFIPLLNSNLKMFRETEDLLSTFLREGRQIQEIISPLVDNKPGTKESLKKQLEDLQRVIKNVKALQDEVSAITHNLKENSKTYDENLQKLNKLSNDLLDEIMQARLVPINMLFQRFHRPIRDLARQMKKQIRLSIRGEETELDRALVDDLFEPLLHIIRNAIDHGLESAEERRAAGKNPEGLIEIKASRDRNQIIIEVSDDGRGIDVEMVKKTAVKNGLMTEKDAAELSEGELFEYLFYPGFSTAGQTTLVSGRGVGLDAVKAQVEKAKGDVRIYTEKSKGTTFSIRVPVSLTVIQSMLVEVSGHVYSIPLLQVEETVNVGPGDLLLEDQRYFIRYREKKIAVVRLSEFLQMPNHQEKLFSGAGNYPVIIVQDEGNRVALLVDKIIRREEILIKSLGPGLRRLKYVSGGSIMADGQVVLVLDIQQIISERLKNTRIGTVAATPPQEAEQPAKPRISTRDQVERKLKRVEGRKPAALIVDDSLSIRKYLSSLLMQKGYVTDTARNGYEALELLNKQQFDIMVTDLEMPKLSGYELIETLRYDQRFNDFPIIVLTGRAGENFRQLTSELGADAYIIKPFKDRELFDQISKFIEYKA